MDEEEDPRNNGDLHVTKKPKLTQFISESEIRTEFSHHEPGVARINNGSFGCCPGSVISAQTSFQRRFLQQPDHFYFSTLRPSVLHSRALIKNLINADNINEVSLVDNATTAAAIVLQQIGRRFSNHRHDSVIMFHCAFPAVKKSIQAYVTRAGGSVIEVQLPFPVTSNDEIISVFQNALTEAKSNGRRIRLAILDHITSMPSVVIPVREIINLCRLQGVDQVFVDAAHAIGSVHIDVKEIGADFYVSNLYKWFFAPPSVAFLYCKQSSLSPEMHHPVVSHEYGNGLPTESAWIGTRDYSPQLVIPAILDFVNKFEGGIEGIMKRNHEQVVKMGELLVNSWGTSLGSSPEMCASMIMVGLPSRLCVNSDDNAMRLRTHLRERHGVEVPTYYRAPDPPNDGDNQRQPRDKDGLITGYVRISHQVYNTVDDYFKLRDAINRILEDNQVCEMLSTD